jgi:hypothetical protein
LFVADSVPKDNLVRANAVTSASLRIGGIAGPAIGGIAVGLGGIHWAFFWDAATFMLSFIACAYAVRRSRQARGPKGKNLLVDAYKGLVAVSQQPFLRNLIFLTSTINMALMAFLFALPIFLATTLHANAAAVGLLEGTMQAGVLLGSLVLSVITVPFVRGVHSVGYIAGLLGGIMWGAAFASSIPVFFLLIALYGIAISFSATALELFFQTLVPKAIRGRIMSIQDSFSQVLQPIGTAAAGLALQYELAQPLMGILGLVCICAGVLLSRQKSVEALGMNL